MPRRATTAVPRPRLGVAVLALVAFLPACAERGGGGRGMPAADLTKAFADDPQGALRRYEAKPVTVEGVVRIPGVGGLGLGPSVCLEGHAPDHALSCAFGGEGAREKVNAFKAGQQVVIRGTVAGFGGNTVAMVGCQLVSGGPLEEGKDRKGP